MAQHIMNLLILIIAINYVVSVDIRVTLVRRRHCSTETVLLEHAANAGHTIILYGQI